MIRPLQEEVRSHLRSGVAITNLTQCVEELVLNSLDAGASCITVRIDIPNFKIQVSDNGNGIALGDLKSVGERYSSSKCHVLEDLEQLSFYGFRGEALASIRETCDVLEIVTRHRSCYQTYCKLFRNSQVLELTESRFPRANAGTSVTIHGIFANLPVRRKALTETLDFERVRHRIASIALIHPKTAFLLINDSTGTKCLQTHVCKSVVSTFSQLFGNQRSKNLQPVKFEHKDFKVSGFISTDTHHSKSLQFLFVNGRLLLKTRIHKLVNHILGKSELLRKLSVVEVKDSTGSEAYQNKMTSPQQGKIADKHGIFVLNIDCLNTEYDICLEPAKTLIEFQDWEKVLYCVERCIEEFLTKHNLFSNVEDSGNSTESEANDDYDHMGNLCCTNLEAFEYKKEIETSNVKKSLHSSTVYRLKKTETRECVSQDKSSSCLEKECSDFLLSDGKCKHVCESATNGSGLVISEDLTASDSKSLSKEAISSTANVDKHPSSSTNKNAKDLYGSSKQVAFNDKTTCRATHIEGRTTLNDSSADKEAQNEVNNTCTTADLVATLPAHSHCILSDLEKAPSSHPGLSGIGHSNATVTIFNELPKKNRSGRVCASDAFPRTTCSKSASVDKVECLPVKSSGSGSAHSSERVRFIPLSNSNHNLESSTVLPRQTGTSSTKINKERSVAMPAFTSPCPITLKGQCTRKRPQSNKEASVSELALPSKNRRLISLQGSCQSRVRCKNAGRFSDVKDGESSNCDTNCSHITQKSTDNNCSTKSSTTSDDCIITPTSTNNLFDTAMYNSDVNCCDSSSGVTVSIEETCDSSQSFDLIQLVLSDFTDQFCSSRIGIESQQCEEHGSLNSVVSSLNVTEKERIMLKCTEYLDCPQKESTEKKGIALEQDEIQCSMMAESNPEPNLNSVDKNDIHERKFSSDNEWYCTFDKSLGRKLFINTRTGHSSFEGPCKFNAKDDDCSEEIVTEANEKGKDCSQHLPHPCASHLSFSCTPWLPRGDRRQRSSVNDDENDILCPEGKCFTAFSGRHCDLMFKGCI